LNNRFLSRSAWLLALALVVGVFPSAVTHAGELPPPAMWMPATASRIVYLDWASLLASPSLGELSKILEQRESGSELEEFRELTGMDPWNDIWALCFFQTSSGTTAGWGLAAYGAFDRTRAIETLESRRSVERSRHQDVDLYTMEGASSGPRFRGERAALAFPDDTTLLYGPASQLRAMLDAGLGLGASLASGPLGALLNERSEAETFWAVGRGGAALSESADLGSRLPPLVSYTLSARFGTVVSVAARGETTTPEQASAMADVLRGMKALNLLQQKGDDALSSVLETLEIETLDEVVKVTLEVDGKTLRELFSRRMAEGTASRP
jgi:hypothetical protein